jgi:hypothetical protein
MSQRKNPSAVLLGKLSALKRWGSATQQLRRLTKKRKHTAAASLGRLGGLHGTQAAHKAAGQKGGRKRAETLDAVRTRAIASLGAKAKWARFQKNKLRNREVERRLM